MKKIVKNHLNKRFPANQNFLQYIDEEMRSYLIALCASFYPDSENNAYILSGVEMRNDNETVSCSQGYVFYNNEIFFVPAFTVSDFGRSAGLAVQTNTYLEEYGSGETLPAFEEKIMIYAGAAPLPLQFYALIRKNWNFELSENEINVSGAYLQKKEGKVILGMSTQMLLLHLQVLPTAANINTGVSFYTPALIKYGLLGFGKVVNKSTHKTYDVAVYKVGDYILIKRPWDDAPVNTGNVLKWSELWQYVNPPIHAGEEGAVVVMSGGGDPIAGGDSPEIGGEVGVSDIGNPADTDVFLYLNLTHERV